MIHLAPSIALPLQFANRHGLVTGATGTGKTVTLQRLAEQFSAAGVPVFAADIKGDLSGIAATGDPARFNAPADRFPVALWDIFGERGLPIRTSIHAMGPQLLASMLRLNETQAGALAIAFRKAKDDSEFFLGLDDLRWALNTMLENREDVCQLYGNVTASSISTIQRNILALEAQGGHHLFGEPPFGILDFMRLAPNGRGVVNLLHADQLMEAPKLYATFLLWLLTELFRKLPEAGDLDKPRLVFFFDEAHLLFHDAPKPLLQQIERLVRLVRSKGVGVYFVTQTPMDVPDNVLAQLGNRIQHALRAYTPKDQRLIRAAAQSFRPNPALDIKAEITAMGIGEALVSVMESDGVPSVTQKVKISPPAAQVGPISDLEREVLIAESPLRAKYGTQIDDETARRRFIDRMHAENNLPPVRWSDQPWQPGDYRQFLPNIGPDSFAPPARKRKRTWAPALFWGAVSAYCFWHVGLFG